MKSKELMIGDWVSYKSKMPCKITAICKDTAVVDNNTEQDWRIDYNKLTPIPLTAEILEKNGFEKMSNSPYVMSYIWTTGSVDKFADVTIQVGQDHANKWRWDFLTLKIHLYRGDITLHKIRYIHQLQHVLQLCGIEKEIEL